MNSKTVFISLLLLSALFFIVLHASVDLSHLSEEPDHLRKLKPKFDQFEFKEDEPPVLAVPHENAPPRKVPALKVDAPKVTAASREVA